LTAVERPSVPYLIEKTCTRCKKIERERKRERERERERGGYSNEKKEETVGPRGPTGYILLAFAVKSNRNAG